VLGREETPFHIPTRNLYFSERTPMQPSQMVHAKNKLSVVILLPFFLAEYARLQMAFNYFLSRELLLISCLKKTFVQPPYGTA
jgi:hypothetical protein